MLNALRYCSKCQIYLAFRTSNVDWLLMFGLANGKQS